MQAFFNHPPPDGSADTALEDVLIDLLAQAAPGAEIRAAWYTFSRRRMARAFVEAAERGVDVRFVLGNTNVQAGCVDWDAVADLKAGLGADHVTVCRPCADGGGCIGDGINHNKFMTVSRLLDGSTDVVMQSSANLTNPQLHQHNNLVVIRGDAALHAAYRAYWEDLRRQRRDLDYYHIEDGADGRRVYFYPRASGDTVVSIIGNTDCAAGARIRVAMAFFTNARLEVARALADARRAGCRVTALLREEPPTYPGDDVLATLRAGGVTVRLFPVVGERSIHSKYLLIDGQYAGSQRRLVWTGSHNYTGPALRGNDETLLRLEDDAVFAAYEADFAAIEAAIRALP
ncbi:MAG: hypothetical protein H6706_30155 [Myxococcales bacterium]|nr:hypothetical protein [Myxococcales bacterium]